MIHFRWCGQRLSPRMLSHTACLALLHVALCLPHHCHSHIQRQRQRQRQPHVHLHLHRYRAHWTYPNGKTILRSISTWRKTQKRCTAYWKSIDWVIEWRSSSIVIIMVCTLPLSITTAQTGCQTFGPTTFFKIVAKHGGVTGFQSTLQRNNTTISNSSTWLLLENIFANWNGQRSKERSSSPANRVEGASIFSLFTFIEDRSGRLAQSVLIRTVRRTITVRCLGYSQSPSFRCVSNLKWRTHRQKVQIHLHHHIDIFCTGDRSHRSYNHSSFTLCTDTGCIAVATAWWTRACCKQKYARLSVDRDQ